MEYVFLTSPVVEVVGNTSLLGIAVYINNNN